MIKYADNVLKTFAAAVSVIISAAASYFVMGDFELTLHFALGAPIVMGATYLYGRPDGTPAPVSAFTFAPASYNHARLRFTYILLRAWPIISARTRTYSTASLYFCSCLLPASPSPPLPTNPVSTVWLRLTSTVGCGLMGCHFHRMPKTVGLLRWCPLLTLPPPGLPYFLSAHS